MNGVGAPALPDDLDEVKKGLNEFFSRSHVTPSLYLNPIGEVQLEWYLKDRFFIIEFHRGDVTHGKMLTLFLEDLKRGRYHDIPVGNQWGNIAGLTLQYEPFRKFFPDWERLHGVLSVRRLISMTKSIESGRLLPPFVVNGSAGNGKFVTGHHRSMVNWILHWRSRTDERIPYIDLKHLPKENKQVMEFAKNGQMMDLEAITQNVSWDPMVDLFIPEGQTFRLGMI